jgi:mRNA-degrading endonuclease toxin of MazEF toxin-antitoxin module
MSKTQISTALARNRSQSEAYVTLNEKQGKAMEDQLTTVSKLRLMDLEGRLSISDMRKVEQAVRVQLGFSI